MSSVASAASPPRAAGGTASRRLAAARALPDLGDDVEGAPEAGRGAFGIGERLEQVAWRRASSAFFGLDTGPRRNGLRPETAGRLRPGPGPRYAVFSSRSTS